MFMTLEKKFRKICNKVGRTINEHSLIEKNDRILVGLSGGKDSYILLEALAERKKALPFPTELLAVHVKVENMGYDIPETYLRDLCHKSAIPLYIESTHVDLSRTNKSPCFVCSWERRKTIFHLTKKLGCNKLAFGHHRDDALQTFLMNMMYHGSISSMPYKLKMFKGRIHLIRPLMDLWEKELDEYARLRNYQKEVKSCPYENDTKRETASDLLKQLEEEYPKSKVNIFHSLSNIYSEYLPKKGGQKEDSE